MRDHATYASTFLKNILEKKIHDVGMTKEALKKAKSEFIKIVNDYKSDISVIDHIDGKLLAITDRNAAKKKVVLIDLEFRKQARRWEEKLEELIRCQDWSLKEKER